MANSTPTNPRAADTPGRPLRPVPAEFIVGALWPMDRAAIESALSGLRVRELVAESECGAIAGRWRRDDGSELRLRFPCPALGCNPGTRGCLEFAIVGPDGKQVSERVHRPHFIDPADGPTPQFTVGDDGRPMPTGEPPRGFAMTRLGIEAIDALQPAAVVRRKRRAPADPRPLTAREREVADALAANGGNVSATARKFGVTPAAIRKAREAANRKLAGADRPAARSSVRASRLRDGG